MSKKEPDLKKKLKAAIGEMLNRENDGQEIKIKFYENGTDLFLIEKTLDTFLSEIESIIDPDSDNNNSIK